MAGPLGFEPRQSAPKALDLPLVDGPITTVSSFQFRVSSTTLSIFVARALACVHSKLETRNLKLFPILRARQRNRRLGWNTFFPQPRGSLFGASLGSEQPIQRQRRARERSVGRPRPLQRTLYVS